MRRMDAVAWIRAILALAFLGVVPGWVWTIVLLPSMRGIAERIVASIVLSVAMLVLCLYVGNLVAGIPISGAAGIGWSLALTLAGLGLLTAPHLHRRLVIASR